MNENEAVTMDIVDYKITVDTNMFEELHNIVGKEGDYDTEIDKLNAILINMGVYETEDYGAITIASYKSIEECYDLISLVQKTVVEHLKKVRKNNVPT